jgi:hypothetical protein
MKNTLLITASVAALVAGIGLASAQGLNEHRDAPAAATSDQKAPEGQSGKQKSALPQKTEKLKPATTVQAPEKEKLAPTAQVPEKTIDSDRQAVEQAPSRGAAPNAAAQKGSVPMSTEQNVKFRETLKGERAERLTNVSFSITIGDEVPRSVHFYRLPARIVEYAPQYRDFDYILVGDDILIVDPGTHKIVAVISA